METGKRYGSISLAESTACETAFERMEAAWQSKDVDAIGEALEGLKTHFIYSNYPWYKRWDELKPLVVNALWHGWPRERFWNIEGHRNLHLWEIPEALEPVAEEFSEDDLKQLCERCDFPRSHRQPRLWARLVEEGNAEFSRWLIERIETDLSNPKRLEAVQTHGHKSAFRVFHWQPFRPEVATPLGILARRRDAVALAQTRHWLRELPFANDRSSTESFLIGVVELPYPELESDFEAAVDKFAEPSDLRLLIFERFAMANLPATITHFFADLRGPMDEYAREAYLLFLDLQLPRWKLQNGTTLQGEMGAVTCRGWSIFMRGYWASIAEQNSFPSTYRAGLLGHLADKMVRLFDDTRPFVWGGCLMGWPMFLFVGFVIQTLMTLIWGAPSKQLMAFNWTLTLAWATFVAATATFDIYHGGELRRSRFKMALFSFGLLASMLIFGIGSRVL